MDKHSSNSLKQNKPRNKENEELFHILEQKLREKSVPANSRQSIIDALTSLLRFPLKVDEESSLFLAGFHDDLVKKCVLDYFSKRNRTDEHSTNFALGFSQFDVHLSGNLNRENHQIIVKEEVLVSNERIFSETVADNASEKGPIQREKVLCSTEIENIDSNDYYSESRRSSTSSNVCMERIEEKHKRSSSEIPAPDSNASVINEESDIPVAEREFYDYSYIEDDHGAIEPYDYGAMSKEDGFESPEHYSTIFEDTNEEVLREEIVNERVVASTLTAEERSYAHLSSLNGRKHSEIGVKGLDDPVRLLEIIPKREELDEVQQRSEYSCSSCNAHFCHQKKFIHAPLSSQLGSSLWSTFDPRERVYLDDFMKKFIVIGELSNGNMLFLFDYYILHPLIEEMKREDPLSLKKGRLILPEWLLTLRMDYKELLGPNVPCIDTLSRSSSIFSRITKPNKEFTYFQGLGSELAALSKAFITQIGDSSALYEVSFERSSTIPSQSLDIESSLRKEWEVVLLLDSREVRTKTDRTYLQTRLRSRGVLCETRTLVLGDFQWVCRPSSQYLSSTNDHILSSDSGFHTVRFYKLLKRWWKKMITQIITPPVSAIASAVSTVNLKVFDIMKEASTKSASASAVSKKSRKKKIEHSEHPDLLSNSDSDGNIREKTKSRKKKVNEDDPSYQPPPPKEYPLDLLIERKATSDLAASIVDGRYQEQKQRLLQSGCRIIYLVEGDPYQIDSISVRSTFAVKGPGPNKSSSKSFQMKGNANTVQAPRPQLSAMRASITTAHLLTAMSSTQITSGFRVINPYTIDSTVDFLVSMHRTIDSQFFKDLTKPRLRLSLKSRPFFVSASETESHCRNPLCRLISRPLLNSRLDTLESFTENAKKPRILKVMQLFARMLRQVHGCSAARVEAVIDKYPTPISLAKAYASCQSLAAGKGLLALLPVPGTRMVLGASISERIFNIFWGSKGVQNLLSVEGHPVYEEQGEFNNVRNDQETKKVHALESVVTKKRKLDENKHNDSGDDTDLTDDLVEDQGLNEEYDMSEIFDIAEVDD